MLIVKNHIMAPMQEQTHQEAYPAGTQALSPSCCSLFLTMASFSLCNQSEWIVVLQSDLSQRHYALRWNDEGRPMRSCQVAHVRAAPGVTGAQPRSRDRVPLQRLHVPMRLHMVMCSTYSTLRMAKGDSSSPEAATHRYLAGGVTDVTEVYVSRVIKEHDRLILCDCQL